MSSAQKYTREGSMYRNATYSDDASGDEVAKKAGTKRLFSNRDSRFHNVSQQYGAISDNEVEEEVHSEKRQRNSDWPLRNTLTASPSNTSHLRSAQRNRKAAASPLHRPTSEQVRQSKFLEGSMNDRVSRVPPAPYLGDQERFERYEQENYIRERKLAQPRKFTQHPGSTADSVAGQSDMSRQSSIFRFGKTIAATFNPTNWFGRSKHAQSEYTENPQEKILRQRKEKAEQIYEELKQSGRFVDSHGPPPQFNLQDRDLKPGKHDSGVMFGCRLGDSAEMTREEKRMGRIFLESPHGGNRVISPGSESIEPSVESTRKSGFYFQPPSLSSIRMGPGSDRGSVPPESGDHQAKRVPSRKDLQYQQRLVKRVSDLESKLDSARRKLSEALHEPVPSQTEPPSRMGRPRFVPGALSTLPSERLLAGYVNPDSQAGEYESFSQIGKAFTVDRQTEPFMTGAIDDSYGDAVAAALLRDKSLPEIPIFPHTPSSDHVIESVESEGGPKASVNYHDDDHHDDEDPERFAEASEEEELKLAKKVSPVKTTATSKKRKSRSSFERLADDDGKYKLEPESDDSESIVENIRASMKVAPKPPTARPNKLQKTATQKSTAIPSQSSDMTSSPAKHDTSPQKGRQPVTHSQASRSNIGTSATIKTVASTVSRSPSKLAKARKVHQTMSPPPSTSFPLEYPKQSSRTTKKGAEIYSAVPADDSDVPPMPKLPKAVRLPSGEVVCTASAGAKLSKSRPAYDGENGRRGKREENKENALNGKDSFVWERDVF